MVRLYLIHYLIDEECEEIGVAVVPEWSLPEIDDIIEISLAGYLMEGLKVVVDEEPDPKDKEPIPINRASK